MQLPRSLTKFRVAVLGAVCVVALAPTGVNAAVNYFDATSIVSGSGSVTCPSGSKITGGGAYPLPADSFSSYSSTEYQLTGSYPTSTTGWKVTATKTSGTYSSSSGWRFNTSNYYSTRVYAICVK